MGKLRNVHPCFMLASYASYKSYCRFDPPTSWRVSAGCVLNDLVELSFAPENCSLQQIKRARKTLENEASWISRAINS